MKICLGMSYTRLLRYWHQAQRFPQSWRLMLKIYWIHYRAAQYTFSVSRDWCHLGHLGFSRSLFTNMSVSVVSSRQAEGKNKLICSYIGSAWGVGKVSVGSAQGEEWMWEEVMLGGSESAGCGKMQANWFSWWAHLDSPQLHPWLCFRSMWSLSSGSKHLMCL